MEIPGGTFRMGSSGDDEMAHDDEKPQHDVDLPAFEIARYPVTNAQFGAFVKAGGYSARDYWTEEGWAWKEEREGPDALPAEYLLDNHPRVDVTWHEACAFCKWLSGKLGREVRLPTEAEWEKAARGPDGRIFPWGDVFEASRCNAFETGIGQTSAVGAFPAGMPGSCRQILPDKADLGGNRKKANCRHKPLADMGLAEMRRDRSSPATLASASMMCRSVAEDRQLRAALAGWMPVSCRPIGQGGRFRPFCRQLAMFAGRFGRDGRPAAVCGPICDVPQLGAGGARQGAVPGRVCQAGCQPPRSRPTSVTPAESSDSADTAAS